MKGRADIVAICDIDKSTLAEIKKEEEELVNHTIQDFVNYADLVCDENVDVVMVMAPDFMHHEMAMAAIRAKKHLFLEKPVGISLEQMLRMH